MKGIIGLILLVLSILAIVDCVKSNKTGGKKALWIAIVLLLQPAIGVILYYLIGKKQ